MIFRMGKGMIFYSGPKDCYGIFSTAVPTSATQVCLFQYQAPGSICFIEKGRGGGTVSDVW
jgi:hypothetical protein